MKQDGDNNKFLVTTRFNVNGAKSSVRQTLVILRKTYIAGIVNLRTETLIRWKILLSYNFRINVNRHDVSLLCWYYLFVVLRWGKICEKKGEISWIVTVRGTEVLFDLACFLVSLRSDDDAGWGSYHITFCFANHLRQKDCLWSNVTQASQAGKNDV